MISNAINDRYGSKMGLLNYLKYNALRIFGKYRFATRIDFSTIDRCVFVCSGNICRSALGECVMKKLGAEAASFGLDTRGGDPADPRMIAYAKTQGFDLSSHITKSVSIFQSRPTDLLIGMEPKHLDLLVRYFPNNQITALGLWLPEKNIYLHDPYATNSVYFNRCAEKIINSVYCLHKIYNKAANNTI